MTSTFMSRAPFPPGSEACRLAVRAAEKEGRQGIRRSFVRGNGRRDFDSVAETGHRIGVLERTGAPPGGRPPESTSGNRESGLESARGEQEA